MYKILVITTFIVTTAIAYNFQDSHFNEVLFKDIQELSELQEESFNRRLKRDADSSDSEDSDQCKSKKEGHHYYKCCNDDIDHKEFKDIKEARKECFVEIHGNDSVSSNFDPFTCEKLDELKNQITCLGECIGRKLNIVDENGDAIKDALVEYKRSKLSESDWKYKEVEGIAEKCVKLANEGKTDKPADDNGGKICNPSALKVAHCMWREFVKACPAEFQSDTTKCKRVRELIEKNDLTISKGLFFHHFHYHEQEAK